MFEIGKLTRLDLGYQGESDTRVIEIDVSAWLERFPAATIVVQALRPDRKKYLPAFELENGILTWVVDRAEVSVPGNGVVQIAAINLETGAEYRSRVVETIIKESLQEFMNELEDGDPMENWVSEVVAAAVSAEESMEAAKRYEENAAKSETEAKSSEEAARKHAGIAVGSADSAAQSAKSAASSATNAAKSASDADETLRSAQSVIAEETNKGIAAIKEQETASLKQVAESTEAAAQHAANAAQSADRAEMAATNSGWFDVDVNDAGHLIYTRSSTVDNIDFEMEEGRLLVNYG